MGYGNIMEIETTGASMQTAQQNGLKISGVSASHQMAKRDAARMEKYRKIINKVGAKYEIAPALIAAIISRESRADLVDQFNVWGLMQVGVNPSGGRRTAGGVWDSEDHLCKATKILVYFIECIRTKFSSWSAEQQLKGGIAAYNIGDENIHSIEDMDVKTTGGDYSNDVVARAQWYQNNGGF